jgi:hypothetical protein
MTEQIPGELIYEYTIRPTGATSYGVPALDTLLSVRMLSSGIARPPLALATAPTSTRLQTAQRVQQSARRAGGHSRLTPPSRTFGQVLL